MHFDFLTIVTLIGIAVTLTLQVLATRRVRRERGIEPEQRRAQMYLIWLLPIFGAAIVLTVLTEETTPKQDSQSERRS